MDELHNTVTENRQVNSLQ